MDKDQLRDLKNILNYDFGLRTILLLLQELGAFEKGLNRNSSTKEDYLTLGKREKGAWLLECIYLADQQRYIEILEKNKKEKKL